MIQLVFAVLILLSVTACSGQAASARNVVYAVDASGSVTSDALTAAVASVEQGLQALERGDRIAVIPVTGDVHAETLGRVLRFELAARREPYDADRRRLQREVYQRLSAFIASAKPSSHTDLLSTFRLAAEELQSSQVRVLVCLTDFIQDDTAFNFKTDWRLENEYSARDLAQELAGTFPHRFPGVSVYLGSLQSTDLARLSKSRRAAIRVFWLEFFAAQGAIVNWATDGPSHVSQFIRRASDSVNRTLEE